MKNSIVIRRVKAFFLDYLIILVYIGLLFCCTLLAAKIFNWTLDKTGPVSGELISFIFLTLPVILYFSLAENSRYAGTFGKKKLQLQVVKNDSSKARFGTLLIRNSLKFLPWEIAHFFIYQLFYFDSTGDPTPAWVLTGLVIAQLLAVLYLLLLIFQKNNRSLYELLSHTKVIDSGAQKNV